MPTTSKAIKENPCAECDQKTAEGIICDTCDLWLCPTCINSVFATTLTPELYAKLQTFKEFPWQCHKCSTELLPKQLVAAKLFSEDDLIALKVNPAVFAFTIPKMAKTNPDSGSAMKEVVELLKLQQESMAQQQKQQNEQLQSILTLLSKQVSPAPVVGQNAVVPSVVPAPSAATFPQASRVNSLAPRLPKFTLPDFYGDRAKWRGWWEIFHSVIDSSDMDGKFKWDYLLSVVKGAALRKIEGLGQSSANYVEAIKILKSVYGREDLLKSELWCELDALKMVKSNLENLEEFTDLVGAKAMALKQLGIQTVTLDEYTSILFQKLPANLKSEMKRMKILASQALPGAAVDDGWTLDSFINMLVQIHNYSVPHSKAKPKEVEEKDFLGTSQVTTTHVSTVSSLLQSKGGKGKYQAPIKPGKRLSQALTCLFCDGDHWSDMCKVVSSVDQRRQIASQKSVCFKCLKPGHLASGCSRSKPCFYCSQPTHNSALCFKRNHQRAGPQGSPRGKQLIAGGSKKADDQTDSRESGCVERKLQVKGVQGIQHAGTTPPTESTKSKGSAIMAILPSVLYNPSNGKSCQVKVYLDGGAENTAINQSVADKLDLHTMMELTMSTASFGEADFKDIPGKIVQFAFEGPTGYHMQMSAIAVSSICPVMSSKPVELSEESRSLIEQYHVVNKPEEVEQDLQVDLLVGQDYYNIIMHSPNSQIICLEGSLRIHLTPFGSILSGSPDPTSVISKKKIKSLTKALLFTTKTDIKNFWSQESIDPQGIDGYSDDVSKLWSLESIGINQPTEDAISPLKQFFKDTIARGEDGRYQVRLPFKQSPVIIDANFNVALKRLRSVLKRLCPGGEETELLKRYNAILQELFQRQITEIVHKNQKAGPVLHYLSHFPVIRECSATTKVRSVLDPSLKTRDGTSLNDHLHVGINLMEDLTGLLLRFRLPTYVLLSDIEKAFLMVALHPDDRDAVRFLWLKDPTNPTVEDNLVVYRYCRVPFGLKPSPYLLCATIEHHVEASKSPVAEKLKNQIYMDNAILGAESAEECLEIYKDAKKLFQEAQMNLREWQSNCPGFQDQIPKADSCSDKLAKVLGIQWNIADDNICLKPNIVEANLHVAVTKRIILHAIAKTFDPLGLVSPVTIRGRILIQDLWRNNNGWDTPISSDEVKTWLSIVKDMNQLQELSFQRKVVQDLHAPAMLLCFADASPLAYAVVTYIKQQSQVRLLYAKAKVAPLKPAATVPRLELLGILIGTRALSFVEQQLKIKVDERFLWSDSQIAISQVKSDKKQPVWIQHRTDEIRNSSPFELRYIPGAENPADHATRGCSLTQLLRTNWFTGPEWLHKDVQQWPQWPMNGNDTSQLVTVGLMAPRQKKTTTYKGSATSSPFDLDPTNYSSLLKLFRVTAYCLRFYGSLKGGKPGSKVLSAEELAQAKRKWILWVQECEYPDTLSTLHKKKCNQLVSQLDLFLDEHGVIRVGGRMANAPLDYHSKFPALLPKAHPFTQLVIMDSHRQVFHFKIRHTHARVRLNYYIPQGLSTVRKALKSCLICQKVEGKPFQPPRMGQLPVERLSRSPAWKYTALDYMGPLMIKAPGKDSPYEKRWIALFTCFTSRAIHLEVVQDCSTEAAIRAVERFIARRGTPKLILSDNQSSFLSAAKGLKLIWDKQTQPEDDSAFAMFFSQEGIKWTTIPEGSPWYNGLTERLVSLVKRAIKKTLWRACLTHEELETLIVKIEGVLNSRPLLSTGSEHNDGAVLTPAHFIAPGTQLGMPPWDDDPNDPDWMPNPKSQRDLLQAYKKNQKKLDAFWKIYYTQYLQELRDNHRLRFNSQPGEIKRKPVVGEVCLLQENGPRLHWPLARIEELLTSTDGETRYVKVKLPSGTITRRGVKDLIPLEIALESEPTKSTQQLLSFAKRDPTPVFPPVNSMAGHQQFKSSYGSNLINSLGYIGLIICLLSCLPTTMASSIKTPTESYQICLQGPGGRVLQLPRNLNCVYPPHAEHKRLNVTIFVPTHNWPKGPAYLCYKEKTKVCTSTSFVGGKGLVQPATVIKTAATLQECSKASQTFEFNGTRLVQDKTLYKFWSTRNILDVKYKWMMTVCSEVENFILEVGEVTSHDGKTLMSNLLPADHCKLEVGYCYSLEAVLVWSLKAVAKFCPYERKGSFTAVMGCQKFITIPSLQSSFHLLDRRGFSVHSCLPRSSQLTQEGAFIYLGVHSGHQKAELDDSIHAAHQPSELNHLQSNLLLIDSADPVNAKLNFLVSSISSVWQEQFSKEHYQFCLLAQKELDIVKQLILLDPTSGVRALLARDDIAAELHGNILYVNQCNQVQVSSVFTDFRHPDTGKCHVLQPVNVNGRIMFATAGSKDLVPFAPEISCEEIPTKISAGKFQPIFMHNIFAKPQLRIKFPVFSTSALFKSRVAIPPEVLKLFSLRVIGVEKRLQATINYTSHISLDPSVIRETLIGIGEMTGSVLEGFGGFVHEALDGVGEMGEHLLSPIYILVISIVTGAIILGILAIGLFKLYSDYKFKQRVKIAKQTFKQNEDKFKANEDNLNEIDDME